MFIVDCFIKECERLGAEVKEDYQNGLYVEKDGFSHYLSYINLHKINDLIGYADCIVNTILPSKKDMISEMQFIELIKEKGLFNCLHNMVLLSKIDDNTYIQSLALRAANSVLELENYIARKTK